MSSKAKKLVVAEKIWTPANIVTMIRICLVPVFVAAFLMPWPEWLGLSFISDETKALIAAALFILISCTDWVDGYLARSRGEVTDFGKFMDPLADKILVAAALLALVELQVLPSWPVLIILGREFIVSGVRMMAAAEGVVIAASWYGKAKTVFQMVAIVMFIVKDNLSLEFPTIGDVFGSPFFVASWAVMGIALILTIMSMMDYLSKARHLIGFAPKDGTVSLSPKALEKQVRQVALETVALAKEKNVKISFAESLTGGMIGAALTSIPGSSAVMQGGINAYDNEVKTSVLKVDSDIIALKGAVSEEVACQMAVGGTKALTAHYCVSATGIAGPDGGSAEKPVGTVWIGLSDGSSQRAELHHFEGDRELVRLQTTFVAISTLRDALKSDVPSA